MSLFVKALIERAIRAGVAAFAGSVALALTNPNLDMTAARAALVAAVGAGVSAIITTVSQAFGQPNSGSFLPAAPDLNG
jgi:hypothetical protein